MKINNRPESVHDIERQVDVAYFGFWVYLMTDCILFASLFAVYAVLKNNTYGGPSGLSLFSLSYVLIETIILLTSSLTVSLMNLEAIKGNLKRTYIFMGLTFILGLSFILMEIAEFGMLINKGDSWQRSGFLSGYFVLVGTHGLHIIIGLLWMIILAFALKTKGLRQGVTRKLMLFSLFWHFLDLVWIFIFTIVYLFSNTGVIR